MKPAAVRYFAGYDEDEKRVYITEHVCRVVRKGVAHMTEKNEHTWGKRSKKHGDYGWLDPIWQGWKVKLSPGCFQYRRYNTTKVAAIRAAIASERASKSFYESQDIKDKCDVAIAALQRALKRHTSTK